MMYWNSHVYYCVRYDSVCYHSEHPSPHTLHPTIIWRISYVCYCMIWYTGTPIYTTAWDMIRCAIMWYILHPIPYTPPLYGGLDTCSTVWYDVLEFPFTLLSVICFGVLLLGTSCTPYPTPHHYMANKIYMLLYDMMYGVALFSRIDKMMGLFCERAL